MVPKAVADVVLILYQLDGYRTGCAVAYLRQHAAWRLVDRSRLVAVVEDLVLASADEHFLALVDAEAPRNPLRLDRAARFYNDWSLCGWVQTLNLRKGVAPRSSEVLTRRRSILEQQPLAVPSRTYTEDFASIAAKQWMKRWRKRWHGRYKKLLCRDKPSLGESREKARVSFLGGSFPSDVQLLARHFFGSPSQDIFVRLGVGFGWDFAARHGRRKRLPFFGTRELLLLQGVLRAQHCVPKHGRGFR